MWDAPNDTIGKSLPRSDAKRLLEDRGRYVDELVLPRMLHAAFLRSPLAHAEIRGIDTEEAAAAYRRAINLQGTGPAHTMLASHM